MSILVSKRYGGKIQKRDIVLNGKKNTRRTQSTGGFGGENRICPSVARGGSETTDTLFQAVLFAKPETAKQQDL